ncbi:hypothetical protein NQ315_013145 [Exocentrus adspersus]|uniref:Uncharacterized protein n=1 Tax=Exocentrus adspersus TaxID=1586481 RepID=A0AAV8VWN3_9CUCU|nr:hypothetical protein NQ315_013145 [Exocentrus adspersus]
MLNKKLERVVDRSVEDKFMNKDVVTVTVKQLKKIKLLYRDITDLVEKENSLVGWQIFCLMAYTLLYALSLLNSVLVGESIQSLKSDAVGLLIIIIYDFYVALSCDLTNYEGKKIIKLCYNLEEKFSMNSPIRHELLELAEQAKFFAPRFVSVGLFDIKRKMLLSMMTTITTYIIVIIQYNNVL